MIEELKDFFPEDDWGQDARPVDRKERMKWKHLVKVLSDDIDNPVWEKAHLALFLSVVPSGSRMQRLVARANAAYDRQDRERFVLLLVEMREAAERKDRKDGKAV